MKNGFTLLELSIVLVIIGLIIGGVAAGQTMIRNAELNTVVSDINKYKLAAGGFELKYNYRPGDLPNADSYWPGCTNGDMNPFNQCNGDGNGNFLNYSSLPAVAHFEGARAWQHMSLSGVIEGSYLGTTASYGLGSSFPEAALSGLGYQFTHIGDTANRGSDACISKNHHSLYGIGRKDVLVLGAQEDAITNCLDKGTLDVVSAHSLDQKMDDGRADSGTVLTANSDDAVAGCAGRWDNSVVSGSYNLTDTTNNCHMVFIID